MASVPFVALASGVADFIADTTNLSTGDDTLLFGLDNSVPPAQVRFVDALVQITAVGEGEASGSSVLAAAVDQIFADELWLSTLAP